MWNAETLPTQAHQLHTHCSLYLHSPSLDSVICVMKSALVCALCPVWELCIRCTLDTVYHTHILDQTVCQPHAHIVRVHDCSSFTIFLSMLFVYFAGKSDGVHTHTHLFDVLQELWRLAVFFLLPNGTSTKFCGIKTAESAFKKIRRNEGNGKKVASPAKKMFHGPLML